MNSQAQALGLVVLALAAAAAPFMAGDYLIGVGLTLLSWIALTQSWVVLSGMSGYISLGHVVFYGIGGYVTVLLFGGVPLWIAVPLSGLAAALFAALVGYPAMRVRGPYFVILTYGMAELVKFIVIDIEAKLGKFGRLLLGAPDLRTIYFAMLALAIAGTLMAIVVRRSRLGYGLRAIREDEQAAETMGVPVARFKLCAFVLSAFLPGMVGALMALRTTYFEPLPAFNPVVSFTIVTIAVIGGSDDARGPMFGALFLVVLSELLWANAPEFYMILLGLVLIAFVLFAPGGLCGLLARAKPAAA
jgi:branched-chain amino acid transport system permease protein